MTKSSKLLFVTGNAHKAEYFSRLIGVNVDYRKINLDEIQSSNLDEVVKHKAKQAYRIAKRPVLVEDVALGVDDLGGLPGPFIKFFVDIPNGLSKICRMCDGLKSRRATAICVFGYYDGKKLKLFRGQLAGEIAMNPRGGAGFGWDKIFCPDGYNGKTRAELPPEDDEVTYRKLKPIVAVQDFLTKSRTNDTTNKQKMEK